MNVDLGPFSTTNLADPKLWSTAHGGDDAQDVEAGQEARLGGMQ